MARVAITIVAWNSMKFLPEVLASVARQTHKDPAVIIVDNASTDGLVEYVRADHPQAILLRNAKNLGFGHAHNQAIAYAKTFLKKDGEELYVLTANPDVIMEPDYVAKLVAAMEARPDAGSAAGKLLKVIGSGEGEFRQGLRTGLIDSAGLCLYKSGRVAERGAGEDDSTGHYGRTEEVFGVSAALAMYRMSALEDVAYRGEYFDGSFFAYKEDVDLAWRLRLRGWKSLYLPEARAGHHRTASGSEKTALGEVLARRRRRSPAVKYYSYRNHFLVMLKNGHLSNLLLFAPRIGWYEMKKLAFISAFEPSTLRALAGFFRRAPAAWRKRRLALGRATVSAREMRKWFV